MRFTATVLALILASSAAQATEIKELVRFAEQAESVLTGYGLVIGLPGTGDSGNEPFVAGPMLQLMRNLGNAVGDIEQLKNSQAVAAVIVTCRIPASGVALRDQIDVSVAVIGSASSLEGGRLFVSPLTLPLPNGDVYAFAEGPIEIEGDGPPTVGRVRRGATMVKAVQTDGVGDAFDLIVRPAYAGWPAASYLASTINQEYFLQPGNTDRIATAVDSHTVRVLVPAAERLDKAAFITQILSTAVNPTFLGVPARVVVNHRTGAIVVTADVEISPVAVTLDGLSITTTVPAPVPSPANPVVQADTWTGLATSPRPRESARLADLLAALNQLEVPPRDQIGILATLSRMGKLHAEFIIDE